MDNEKIKLDDSILEDIETDIDYDSDENENSTSIFDKEVSIDELFDFMPKGSVGDEQEFLNNSLKIKEKNESKFKTKKQQIKAILDDEADFVQSIHNELKEINEAFDKENKINKQVKEAIIHQTEKEKEKNKSFVIDDKNTLFEAKPKFDNEIVETDDNYDLIKIRSLIESALYICGNDGVNIVDLKRLTNLSTNEIKKIMKDWINELENDHKRGMTIKIFGERYKFLSKACNREDLSKLITVRYRNPLSSKVMETLAIIAYNQPCTRSTIENIRAKDPTVTIQKLIDLGLVVEAGRADTPGRPLLYTVTHKFYDIFGIKNLSELPKINTVQPFEDNDISFFDTTRYND